MADNATSSPNSLPPRDWSGDMPAGAKKQLALNIIGSLVGFNAPQIWQPDSQSDRVAQQKYADEQARAKEAQKMLGIVAGYDKSVNEAEGRDKAAADLITTDFDAFLNAPAVKGAPELPSELGAGPEATLSRYADLKPVEEFSKYREKARSEKAMVELPNQKWYKELTELNPNVDPQGRLMATMGFIDPAKAYSGVSGSIQSTQTYEQDMKKLGAGAEWRREQQEASDRAAQRRAETMAGSKEPRQNASDEQGLRKEFSSLPEVKNYIEAKTQAQIVSDQIQANSAAGDLAAIFAFMKTLDPTSAVRETEFANAQNAAGVPEQWRNKFNQIRNGTRLSPEQRKEFIASVNSLMESRKQQYDYKANYYRDLASQYGYNPDRIVGVGSVTPPAPPKQPADQGTPPAPTATGDTKKSDLRSKYNY